MNIALSYLNAIFNNLIWGDRLRLSAKGGDGVGDG